MNRYLTPLFAAAALASASFAIAQTKPSNRPASQQIQGRASVAIPFKEFRTLLTENKVKTLTMGQGSSDISGEFNTPQKLPGASGLVLTFVTKAPPESAGQWSFTQWLLDNEHAAVVKVVDSGEHEVQPTPITPQQLYNRVTPSLVAVQYTWASELGRHDLIVAGVVISNDGLVMIPLVGVSDHIPDVQMKDFKIIVPEENTDPKKLDAVFQGRDERSNVAFVKAVKPRHWTPIHFVKEKPAIGQTLYSVGILPKAAAYHSYLNKAIVSSYLRGEIKQILVGDGGLGATGSPVFDDRGQAIGFVNFQPPYPPLLNDKDPIASILNPPKFFTPTAEFQRSLNDPPTPGHPIVLPWAGVSELQGLKKDASEYFGLEDRPAIQIGDVIAGTPAAKAGLKQGEIIVKLNGKPLERGDEADDLPAILSHQLIQMKPGQTVTFTILPAKGEPTKTVSMKLVPRPKPANVAPRYWSDALGFGVRSLVFMDKYIMKLGQTAKGVLVTVVKPQGSASAGHLQSGDLVLQLNGDAVSGLDAFKKDFEAFRKSNPHDPVVIVVRRNGQEETIRIEPPQ